MYTFSATDAKRISKTVKTVERNPASLVGGAYKKPTVKAPPPLNGRFFGEVIAFWPDAYESHYGTREIPANWLLCDGTSGTPNLVDKFIMGGTMDDAGDTGGTEDHSHSNHADLTVTIPDHAHQITQTGGAFAQEYDTGTPIPSETFSLTTEDAGAGTHTLTISAHSTETHIPPYVKLCFIMYVGD
jgi:hypothetical protein